MQILRCDFHFHIGEQVPERLIFYICFETYHSVFRPSVFTVFNVVGIDVDSVLRKMESCAVGESETAEDAGTRIPAAVRLHARIHSDGNPVFLTAIDERCDVDVERRIAVVVESCLASAHLDGGVHHRTVEGEVHLFIRPFGWNIDVLCVVCGHRVVITACRAGRCFRIRITFDHVIVRQIYHACILIHLSENGKTDRTVTE